MTEPHTNLHANPHAYLTDKAEEFEFLTSQQERLLALRQYGDYLDPLDAAHKTDANLVPGCASATHLVAALRPDGTLTFAGDSESFISKGYMYLLTEAFTGATLEQVLQGEAAVKEFADRAQVRLSMIQSRANAFENIFHFMQQQAVVASGR